MAITERRSVDGVALSTRQVLEFDYGPTPVSLPDSTVESEAACPEPSGLDDE